MAVKRKMVKPIMEKLFCDNCGEEMKQNNDVLIVLTTIPPQYSYVCSNCNNTTLSKEQYPKIVWEEID